MGANGHLLGKCFKISILYKISVAMAVPKCDETKIKAHK